MPADFDQTGIPDAERRLPHWSAMERTALVNHYNHSRRRKASASLEHVYVGLDQWGYMHSRRRKASASLEPWRTLRTWLTTVHGFQTPKGVCLIGAVLRVHAPRLCCAHSRRRKASASLERRLPAVAPPSLRRFQTPKGVCLIGAAISAVFL